MKRKPKVAKPAEFKITPKRKKNPVREIMEHLQLNPVKHGRGCEDRQTALLRMLAESNEMIRQANIISEQNQIRLERLTNEDLKKRAVSALGFFCTDDHLYPPMQAKVYSYIELREMAIVYNATCPLWACGIDLILKGHSTKIKQHFNGDIRKVKFWSSSLLWQDIEMITTQY